MNTYDFLKGPSIRNELTRTSRDALDNILYGNMSPKEAADYLRNKPTVFRSFGETLRTMYDDDDLMKRLKQFFIANTPNKTPGAIAKNLQNWVADRSLPKDREDLFKIAFALGLHEEQLEYLLALVDGYTIQYRNGRELVLAWFLRNGLTYAEAVDFHESLPAYVESNDTSQKNESLATHRAYTTSLDAATVEDLRECYVRNLGTFGSHHTRAYYYFERYLNQLIMPTSSIEEERCDAYSLQAVMDAYLSMNMPMSRKRSQFTLVQQLLKNHWPNRTALQGIITHKIDVPRKVLMLLYVITENQGFDDYVDEYFAEEEESLENRVSDHWVVLNAILTDSGMACLDMRNTFDWLIVYAIAADEDQAMEERLKEVIAALYGSKS